jgi:hypothetical protein
VWGCSVTKNCMVPTSDRVTKPLAINVGLKLSKLMHVKTIALAKGKQLRQIIVVWCMLERDYQTPASFASDARDTRNAFEPLKEGSLINRVKEPHAGIHLVETQYRVGHGAMIETRSADLQAQRRPGSRTGIVRVSVPLMANWCRARGGGAAARETTAPAVPTTPVPSRAVDRSALGTG